MYLCNISPWLLIGPAECPAPELHVGEMAISLSACAGDKEVVGSECMDVSVTGNSGIDVCNAVVAEPLVVEVVHSCSVGDKGVVGSGCMDVGVICNSGIDMSNSVVGKQSFAVPINSVVSTADNCKVVELVDGSTVDSSSIGNITSFVDKVDTAGFMCICIGDGPNTSGSGREVFKLGATLVLVVQSRGTGELSNAEGLAIRFQKYDYLYMCNNIVLLLKELLHLLLTAVEACLHLLFFFLPMTTALKTIPLICSVLIATRACTIPCLFVHLQPPRRFVLAM